MRHSYIALATIFWLVTLNLVPLAEGKPKSLSTQKDLLDRLSGTWKTGCRKGGSCGSSCTFWASESFLTLMKNGSFSIHVTKDCDYTRRDLSVIVETCRGTFSVTPNKTKVKIRDKYRVDPFDLDFKHQCKSMAHTIPGADERFPLIHETMAWLEGNLWFVNENLYGTRGPLYPYATSVMNDEKPGIQTVYPSPPWIN